MASRSKDTPIRERGIVGFKIMVGDYDCGPVIGPKPGQCAVDVAAPIVLDYKRGSLGWTAGSHQDGFESDPCRKHCGGNRRRIVPHYVGSNTRSMSNPIRARVFSSRLGRQLTMFGEFFPPLRRRLILRKLGDQQYVRVDPAWPRLPDRPARCEAQMK